MTTWTIIEAVEATEEYVWKGRPWLPAASSYAREFAAHFGRKTPLGDVTTNGLDKWCALMEKRGRSAATINRGLAAVSRIMTTAQQRDGFGPKPYFPRRRERAGRTRFLTEIEETNLLGLLEHCGAWAEHDMIVVLVDTGIRMGELFRITAHDVDFSTGLISLWTTKNGQPRSVPMTDRVRAVLSSRISRQSRKARPGQRRVSLWPISRDTFSNTWTQARTQLGLDGDKQFVPHALRHTCASRLVQRGVSLAVVQQWMGHRSITSTMRYAHLTPQNLVEAMEVLQP